MNDVYAQWAAMLQGPSGGISPGGWLFGDVTKAGQGKLQVVCNGLALGPEDLHVPPGLSYTWEEDTGGSDLLRAGDRLLVLVTSDAQEYYILQKAVFT